jgi:hypothetical protein
LTIDLDLESGPFSRFRARRRFERDGALDADRVGDSAMVRRT